MTAQKLGLPLPPPFLQPQQQHDGRQGSNFAVAGAFARDASFYRDIPVVGAFALNTSSSVQLRWFQSLCGRHHPYQADECRGQFRDALFFMGEFGVNDYSLSLFGKNLSQIRSFVPDVVKTISTATEVMLAARFFALHVHAWHVHGHGLLAADSCRACRQEVIRQGATTVVVPGIPPMGCSPPNLAMFASADPADYDPRTGCLKGLNVLAVYHNSLLQEAVRDVGTKHRNVRVIYADFFTPVIDIVESPAKLGRACCVVEGDEYNLQNYSKRKVLIIIVAGFTRDILRCCCGGGGKYNFNLSAGCGMPGSTVCQDPTAYLYWDGHFTEAAHRYIADGWLNSINQCKH